MTDEELLKKIKTARNECSFYYYSEVEYHHNYPNYNAAKAKLRELCAEATRRGLDEDH